MNVSFFGKLIRAAVGILAVFPFEAGALSLRWEANPEPDIAGYEVNYGTESGDLTQVIQAGSATSVALTELQAGETYFFSVTAVNTSGLKSEPSEEVSYEVPVVAPEPVADIPKSGWAIHYVDSAEVGGYEAAYAIDGDPDTYWHSSWTGGGDTLPHEIQIDLGGEYAVAGFRYLPRQTALTVGDVGEYEFYLSLDGETWGSPVASGAFEYTKVEKPVFFDKQNARYVRFVALSDHSGFHYSAAAELSVVEATTVTEPENSAPTAYGSSKITTVGTSVAVTLSASDAEGDALDYVVTGNPAHGTLSGEAPFLTYTPAVGYSGSDSFSFKANDGQADSNVATVAITVRQENTAPVASSGFVGTSEDTPVSFTLDGSDVNGDALTFTVTSSPQNGTLSGTPPQLTYTPADGFSGVDSLTFRVNDGLVNSGLATVSITVADVNDPPVAYSLSKQTIEGTPVSITLTGEDPNGDMLGYSVTTGPSHGVLSGSAPLLTYTPESGFSGLDSFRFKVNDGEEDSALATVSITVIEENNPPVARDISATTVQKRSVSLTLSGSDPDGDPLIYAVTVMPTNGLVSGTPPKLTYQPDPDFSGVEQFTYSVSDGEFETSASVTVQVDPLEAGLIWFPFDEAAGLTAWNVGGEKAAALKNFGGSGGHWVAGLTEGALGFDASAKQYVTITGYKGVTGTDERTVSAWVKTTADGTNPIVSWGESSWGQQWALVVQNGVLRLNLNVGHVQGTTVMNDGSWHHVAVTYKSQFGNTNDYTLFVDGQVETVTTKNPSWGMATLSSNDVNIGKDGSKNYFDGVIDELRFYDRSLSVAEVAGLADDAATGDVIGSEVLAWHDAYFGSSAVDWSADDDRDGTGRLLEYATGSRPDVPDRENQVVRTEVVDGRLQVSHRRLVSADHGLVYSLMVSENLTDWDVVVAGEMAIEATESSDVERVTWDLGSVSDGRGFVRLRVELAQ
nr:Ig-like domain-containing protein [Verrucomicrobiota bacterium JB025]